MNVLVIAPHPDDETIGCGGSLLRHAQCGDRVHVVWLTSGELGLRAMKPDRARQARESEARCAARRLGVADMTFLRQGDWSVAKARPAIKKALVSVLREHVPAKVYLPHPGDDHPDHRPVLGMARAAIRTSRIAFPEVRGYEVWSPLTRFDYVEDITPFMPGKMRALRAHASQLHEFDYVRAVRGLNQFRGALAGKCRYAEVFQDLSEHGSTR